MADQPIVRLLGSQYTGYPEHMVAVVLRCGCAVRADIHASRIDYDRRRVGGTIPCPVGHGPRPEGTPAPAACPECGARLEVEVRQCESGHKSEVGWVGEAPCSHLGDALGQLRLSTGAPPWKAGAQGLWCMGCSFPPR